VWTLDARWLERYLDGASDGVVHVCVVIQDGDRGIISPLGQGMRRWMPDHSAEQIRACGMLL